MCVVFLQSDGTSIFLCVRYVLGPLGPRYLFWPCCRQGLKGPQVRGGRGRWVFLSTWEFVLVSEWGKKGGQVPEWWSARVSDWQGLCGLRVLGRLPQKWRRMGGETYAAEDWSVCVGKGGGSL